jgi:NitT/TauT family transport system substrate-binding protein
MPECRGVSAQVTVQTTQGTDPMRKPPETRTGRGVSRRYLLGTAAGFAATLPLGWSGAHAQAASSDLAAPAIVPTRKKITFSWNQTALCTAAVPMAWHGGFFARHGLDVDLINFGGSTDQLLEALATGKADAALGMVLRWLKPLEGGFDVKLTAGVHGGCMYLVASRAAGITDFASLKGKAIGVADFASPAKNLYSIVLRRRGLDPDHDVEWRQYPDDMLAVAVQKGEIQAYVSSDPLVYRAVERSEGKLFRLHSNATQEYADRTCCVLGIRGSLIRQDRETAEAITRAILEASQEVARNPELAVEDFSKYTPPTTPVRSLIDMLVSYPYGQQPVGDDFRRQIAAYADELKSAGILRANTDTERYARRITADIVA